MVLCFGEPPVRFLCCCCSFLMCFFICRCSFHWFPGYFTMSLALHPGFSGLWNPPPALSSTPDYFWWPLLFHLPRVLWFWVGFFFPQASFTLRSFPTFFAQPAFMKASLGANSYSLKYAELDTDPRNTDPAHLFVWFTVIHNFLYILVLYLCMSILQKVLLVLKTLIKIHRSAATLFSSHENIK